MSGSGIAELLIPGSGAIAKAIPAKPSLLLPTLAKVLLSLAPIAL